MESLSVDHLGSFVFSNLRSATHERGVWTFSNDLNVLEDNVAHLPRSTSVKFATEDGVFLSE